MGLVSERPRVGESQMSKSLGLRNSILEQYLGPRHPRYNLATKSGAHTEGESCLE